MPSDSRFRARLQPYGQALVVLLLAVLGCFFALACEGCRPSTTPGADATGSSTEAPRARLYLVSDLAGALEPCGCVKDQLGGMDRFGALVAAEKAKAANYATLSAGPLFFMDMDRSLREMGVTDLGVPKKIRKMESAFYPLLASVGEALDSGDRAQLEAVLVRNVFPEAGAPGAGDLARYLEDEAGRLASQPVAEIVAGRIATGIAA